MYKCDNTRAQEKRQKAVPVSSFYYTVDRLQSTNQTRSQTQTGHEAMYIIQLQANTQNSRKTGVKRQIKCTINRTPKQRQGRRGRSRYTLAHHSVTTVKSEHFTTVKRRSVTVAAHQRITALTLSFTSTEKTF